MLRVPTIAAAVYAGGNIRDRVRSVPKRGSTQATYDTPRYKPRGYTRTASAIRRVRVGRTYLPCPRCAVSFTGRQGASVHPALGIVRRFLQRATFLLRGAFLAPLLHPSYEVGFGFRAHGIGDCFAKTVHVPRLFLAGFHRFPLSSRPSLRCGEVRQRCNLSRVGRSCCRPLSS